MQITGKALQSLLREAIKKNKILPERPWSVEYTFSMTGNLADDSEGSSVDGFAAVMTSASGKILKIIVDSYWNPQAGDQSGNSIKAEINGEKAESAYVPFKFDDGSKQKLLISNSPVFGVITVSHAITADSLPIVYLVVPNPFDVNDDIQFDIENIGNGKIDVDMSRYVNV
jgi:hypothetical protein